jgi:predicted alpha-1,6-mannanase (GH76 family)
MLITIIVLQSLVNVLRERRQWRLARRSLRELTDIGPGDTEHVHVSATPFWRAVLVRCRKDASLSRNKRARSRKAMRRLCRISEQKSASVRR